MTGAAAAIAPPPLALAGIGIRAIGLHLANQKRPIKAWVDRHGGSSERLAKLASAGAEYFLDGEEFSTREMTRNAAARALSDAGLAPGQVDLLIFTHTRNEGDSPPPASTVSFVQNALGLTNARCFSISQQNCVSIFVAIKLVQAMMSNDPAIANALVVTADHVPVAQDHLRVIDDMTMQSDGACALLLTRDWPVRRVLSVVNRADARYYRADPTISQPNTDYYVSTVATMRSAIARSGVGRDAIGRILPNNVNRPNAERVIRLMRMPDDVLFKTNFGEKGHVFGADPFINLAECPSESGEVLLLYSTGIAGCYGAAVIVT
ncbi:hypothetical protein LWE61_11770 [Sphingobium sufflavum]|uniref:hypothetical protein n=1 Tax=Sphingobium sufflavum TaxID=1129547 RepID=UPI001F3A2DE9|nr:hypothetical protein [Sphingobium sufflavum]MCE7797235.1 hypothetical protein [Sphingobium sufflavum]